MTDKHLLTRSRGRVTRLLAVVLCTVVLTLGAATQAVAETTSVPEKSAIPCDGGRPHHTDYIMGITVKPGRVTLTEGRVVSACGAATTLQNAVENASDVLVVRNEYHAEATVDYRISMLGRPTGHWIRIHSVAGGDAKTGSCTVYSGDPESGGTVADPPPFLCTSQMSSDHPLNWRNNVELTLNRKAEAIGSLTPHDISLADGTFRVDVSYHKLGDPEVASTQTTTFFSAELEGDKPFYENQARTEFSYQIVDDGERTGLWVAGIVTNFKGTFGYSADARCAIYESNPLEGERRLDDMPTPPVKGSPYYCSARGDYPDRGISSRFHGTFHVTAEWR